MNTLLIVDDELSMREFLQEVLVKEGYDVLTAQNGAEALEILKNGDIDLALIDVKMPQIDGLQLLDSIKSSNLSCSVIMMTAYGSEKTAVEAIKRGAGNYIKKPFESIDEVKLIIKKELEGQRLKRENLFLRERLKNKYDFKNIVGQSSKMMKVYEIISKVVNLDSTILVNGESGTGKELVASAIHYNSHRKESPFITVSCGALPENLLESELFGHVKGAFTGAVSNKIGLMEMAQNGTFFLDEIGEAPMSIQVKLLRVLQSKTFKRVGGTKDIRADVRIVAATNKNLMEAVADGTFREDLYYRLNVIPLTIPPLRERVEDIPLLVSHFVKLFCQKYSLKLRKIDDEVYRILVTYPWPGNVRQLENVVERMVALESAEVLTVESIPQDIRSFPHKKHELLPEFDESGIDLDSIMAEVEKKYLLDSLLKTRGTKKNAADLLNISFRSFRYRLQKYDIEIN